MKNKTFLTEAKRREIIINKEKMIIESFSKNFIKIKRIDESYGYSLEEAKSIAKKRSVKGVRQHVNLIVDNNNVYADSESGDESDESDKRYEVSDFVDGNNTVASYGI